MAKNIAMEPDKYIEGSDMAWIKHVQSHQHLISQQNFEFSSRTIMPQTHQIPTFQDLYIKLMPIIFKLLPKNLQKLFANNCFLILSLTLTMTTYYKNLFTVSVVGTNYLIMILYHTSITQLPLTLENCHSTENLRQKSSKGWRTQVVPVWYSIQQ